MANNFGKHYWESRSSSYIDSLDGPYHANRLRMVEALVEGVSFRGKHCLDFGCGDGIFAERLLCDGATVSGIDIDAVMVEAASSRLAVKWPDALLLQGGVEALSRLPGASFDFVFALNVLAYFSPAEEAEYYGQIHRVLKPGGHMVVTHSNELFDMYTLNRYTAAFFDRHFSTPQQRCNISALLQNPDKPQRFVFGVRENPLSYRFKLDRAGFRELRQEFSILHPLPPLLTPQIDFDDINSRSYPETTGWPEEQRWKLMFQCSIFGSLSMKK